MSETLETFYKNLLGITDPWKVNYIERDSKSKEVAVIVSYETDNIFECPVCQKSAKLHDHRKRRWRHLDSCNHKTMIEADVPRVMCKEHGIKQIPVSWAEKHSRFTLEFERVICQEESFFTKRSAFSFTNFRYLILPLSLLAVSTGAKLQENTGIKLQVPA